MQADVWSVSIVLMGTVTAIFIWVALGASEVLANYGPVIESAYRMRTWLLVLAVLVLVWANYRTLAALPYAASHTSSATAVPVVRAEAVGEQWSWTITPSKFVVGQTAEFHVTSKDVNHGFAIYDPEMQIVAQVQAMPGYTNVLRYTFVEPGTYHVLCLEYCGVAHHTMASDITVAGQ